MAPLFPFVQFEFTHALGPEQGRYVVAPDLVEDGPATASTPPGSAPPAVRELEPAEAPAQQPDQQDSAHGEAGFLRQMGTADVLVVDVIEAPPAHPHGLLRRRPRRVAEGESSRPVSLALATVVKATTPLDRGKARAFLGEVNDSEERRLETVEQALDVLNLAIRAYRAAARDPYVVEVTQVDARAVRVGYGNANDVANGRWRQALSVPPPGAPRLTRGERLRPQESMAAVLSGRAYVLDADDLIVRALFDLDHGRVRCGAVQLAAAIDSMVRELGHLSLSQDMSERLAGVIAQLEYVSGMTAREPGQPYTENEAERLRRISIDVTEAIDLWRDEMHREW